MRKLDFKSMHGCDGFQICWQLPGGDDPTIASDPEGVIARLARVECLKGRRVLFRDVDNLWHELEHDGEKFSGFKLLGAKAWREASVMCGGKPAPEPASLSHPSDRCSIFRVRRW